MMEKKSGQSIQMKFDPSCSNTNRFYLYSVIRSEFNPFTKVHKKQFSNLCRDKQYISDSFGLKKNETICIWGISWFRTLDVTLFCVINQPLSKWFTSSIFLLFSFTFSPLPIIIIDNIKPSRRMFSQIGLL